MLTCFGGAAAGKAVGRTGGCLVDSCMWTYFLCGCVCECVCGGGGMGGCSRPAWAVGRRVDETANRSAPRSQVPPGHAHRIETTATHPRPGAQSRLLAYGRAQCQARHGGGGAGGEGQGDGFKWGAAGRQQGGSKRWQPAGSHIRPSWQSHQAQPAVSGAVGGVQSGSRAAAGAQQRRNRVVGWPRRTAAYPARHFQLINAPPRVPQRARWAWRGGLGPG